MISNNIQLPDAFQSAIAPERTINGTMLDNNKISGITLKQFTLY